MTTTLDLAALRQAVTLDPADGALRLVYADCLEEHGGWEEAACVRVSCIHPDGKMCRPPGAEVQILGMGGRLHIDLWGAGLSSLGRWSWTPRGGWERHFLGAWCPQPPTTAVRAAVLSAVEQVLRADGGSAPA